MPPKDEKLVVDLTNRPSEKNQHTSGEWVDHIHLRESSDTIRDIRAARDRLGQFSVRFVTEAIYGEEFAQQIWGENGGHELVRDMVIDKRTLSTLAGDVGGARTKVVAERAHLTEKPHHTLKTAVVTADRGRGKAPPPEVEEIDEKANAQIELLRALLKMMDPSVVKKALGG